MQYTDNLGLKLPEGTDFYDVDDMNYNSQLIDAAISGSGGTAADISYDNSDSGLSATNVQDAIDEVAQSGGGGGVGTVVNLTTTTASFHNKTVTLTGTYATYTTTFDNTGHASVNVYYVGTYDIACEGFHNSVNVTAMGLVLTQGIDEDYCTVNLSTSDSALEGATCTIYFGDPIDDDVRQVTVVDSTLAFSFRATQIGSYTMTSQYGGGGVAIPTTFTVSSLSGSMNVTINSVAIKTFAAATDAEIVAMVQAADAGIIDLYEDCGWRVGQERTVHLSAMSATGVGESHVAQDVTFVLMNKGGKTLNTPTASGRTTCSFVVGLKDSLKEKGYMNSSNTNVGGWTSSARRTWCNSVFKNAIPSTLLPIFKQFENKTSAGNKSTSINTDVDWFALPSEIEVFGSTTYSASGEGAQFTWYETAANRIKKVDGSAGYWWGRSPRTSDATGFCGVNGDGSTGDYYASNTFGLAPFGVI